MKDSAGASTSTTGNKSFKIRIFSIFACVLLALGGVLLRLPIMLSNLPVSYRVDERIGWEVLLNLQDSWNPDFFHYPTFHYYIISIANAIFAGGDPQALLVTGRAVNLIFVILLSAVTSLLAFKALRSIPLALFVFALVIFSPVLAESSLYINTDIQVTFFIFLSIYLYVRSVETSGKPWLWFSAVVVAGLAVASKYSALGYVAALFIAEYVRPRDEHSLKNNPWLEKVLPYRLVVILFIITGICAIAAGIFLNAENFRPLLQSGATVSSAIDPADIIFIDASLLKARFIGFACLIFALLIAIFHERPFLKKLLRYRQVAILVIVVIVFLLVTPYALLDWKKFLYDFAFEIKANSFSREGSQWVKYIWRSIETHGYTVFLLALLGIYFSLRALKTDPRYVILLAFFVLYYISIGSAHRGSERYLCPILPAMFIYAAIGIDGLSRRLPKMVFQRESILLVIVAAAAALEMFPKISGLDEQFPPENEHYNAYYKIQELNLKEIYYSGWTPYVELGLKGIEMRPLSFFTIRDSFKNLDSNAVLLVDRQAKDAIGNEVKPENIIWSDEQGFGQYILLKNPARLKR